MKFLRNKKGASLDNIWVMIVMFFLAIFFLALHLFWNIMFTEVTELWTGSSVGTQIRNNANNFINQLDWIYVMVWVGFHLGILATVFLLRTHPVVYIAAIIITAILSLIAAPLSNAWEDLTDETDLVAAAAELPKTDFILRNFPKFEIIWALATMVVLFGLARNEGFV